jgi:hypothetical protein
MSTLQTEKQGGETRSIACQWGPAWLYEALATSTKPKESAAVASSSTSTATAFEVTHVADLTAGGGHNPFTAEFAAYSESCWAEVLPDDYRSLTEPRNYPSPCQWCGGRLHHHPACDELRAESEPKMPFGKHKGQKLSQVPNDYLRWLLAHGTHFEADLRQVIEGRLA